MDYSVNMKPTNLYASGGFLEETVSPEVIKYAQYKLSGAKASLDILITPHNAQ